MQEKCYLVVKNDTITKRYECKDTRESTNTTPYIKIKAGTKSGYIDLTTQTTTGVRPQISNINTTTSTTSSRSSEYIETTGYSGVSSKESTSGYTGYLVYSSTTWEGKDPYIITSYSGKESYTSGTTSVSGEEDQWEFAWNKTNLWNWDQGTRYTSSSKQNTSSTIFSYSYAEGGRYFDDYYGTRATSSFQITNSYPINSTIATTYYNNYPSNFTSTKSNSQTYKSLTSSANIGQLVSTTALTRSSEYSTSSINPGNMSSTTALTATVSRSSQYDTTILTVVHYKPVNSISVTINRTTQSQGTYYTGVKSTTSEYTETTGYSGVSSKESTSGYTGVSSRKSTSGYTGYTITTQTNYSGKSRTNSSYSYVNKMSVSAGGTWFYTARIGFIQKTTIGETYNPGTYTQSRISNKYTGSYIKTFTDAESIVPIWVDSAGFNGFGYGKQGNLKGSVTCYLSTGSSWYTATASTANTYNKTQFTTTKSATETKKGALTSSTNSSNMGSTTALTRSSSYNSSSIAPGNLSSTTALTRSSIYNTSSNTTNAGISSTTALTATSSRSSGYTITTISTNSNISSTATTSGTINYTTTVEVIREENTPTENNNILNVRLNGILNK